MTFHNLLIAILLVGGMVLNMTGPVSATDRFGDFKEIETAYQTGQISQSQMLVEAATLFFAPPALAVGVRQAPGDVLKSGTGLIREIQDEWSSFSPDQQAALAQFLTRPGKQKTFDSPRGFFKIHYDTSGPEAVPPQDANLNGVRDYVERLAAYADSSWRTFVTYNNYLPPPSDKGEGGDNKYDIYALAISGYGATVPEIAADSSWNDCSSYIIVHNTLYGFPANQDPEGDTIGAQKVTCAHEIFHAVQLAYDRDENLAWMEASSTWMEDVVFGEVNDNYNYLPSFFNKPSTGLLYTLGTHMYGCFIWPEFLQSKLDPLVLRRIWESCRYYQSVAAFDSALLAYGTSVKTLFPEFTRWNYYTGARAIAGAGYAHAADYPLTANDRVFTTLVHDSIHPVYPPDGLAGNYVVFSVDPTVRGILDIRLDATAFASWALSAVIRDNAGDTIISQASFLNNPIDLYLPYIEDYQQVTAIPAVTAVAGGSNDYRLSCSIVPYGDSNGDREVNVGDATYIINYIFRDGEAPWPLWQNGDANCDGSIDVADAVYIVSYIFRGGAVPCADR